MKAVALKVTDSPVQISIDDVGVIITSGAVEVVTIMVVAGEEIILGFAQLRSDVILQ